MIRFDKVTEIRNLYYREYLNVVEIASRTGVCINTVKKYLDMEDFSTRPDASLKSGNICPKLDRWKPLIDLWLLNDLKVPRKQRHTALRVYERLTEEDPLFSCSYRTVCTYVAYKRNELNIGIPDPKIPLIHYPGECQGDFGEAVFVENNAEIKGKFFVLDFPYSNSAFSQLHYGENMECLLESMDAIFHYIGGVPSTIWFDNASTMVAEVMRGGGRRLTERFMRFLEHYHIRAVFMNPGKGNEKGSVESKVGYIRRHMLVPVPEIDDLEQFNRNFFQLQEEDMDRCHYRKGRYISDLFREDLKALQPLPVIPFELADYRMVKTDPTGLFVLDKKYTYSSAPEYQKKRIPVKLTSGNVIILNERNEEEICHDRLYGEEPQTAINWIPYLKLIAKKPRAFYNTGFAALLPEDMRQFLYRCDNEERGKILRIIAEAVTVYGIDESKKLLQYASRNQTTDADSFEMLYKRLFLNIPTYSALDLPEKLSGLPVLKPDLSLYDRLLMQGKEKDD